MANYVSINLQAPLGRKFQNTVTNFITAYQALQQISLEMAQMVTPVAGSNPPTNNYSLIETTYGIPNPNNLTDVESPGYNAQYQVNTLISLLEGTPPSLTAFTQFIAQFGN
jgi:hypothetical protein